MLLKDFVNKKLASAEKTADADGVPLTLNNCKKYKKMRDLKVYGNCFQDGTPTPENPIEVQCVGEKSRNLFDASFRQGLSDGTISTTRVSSDMVLKLQANTNYTFSVPNIDSSINYGVMLYTNYDESTTYWNTYVHDSGWKNTNTYVFTPSEDCYFVINVRYANNNAIIPEDLLAFSFQLEIGSKATDYEPYGKYKIPVICRGKNYFSMKGVDTTPKTINGITFTPLGDERVHIKGTAIDTTKSTIYQLNKVCPLPIGTYRAKSHKLQNTGKFHINYGIYVPGGTGFNLQPSSAREITVEGTCIQYLHLTINESYTNELDDIIELQVEKGTTSSEYEPYVEPVTTNIYLNEPLYKLNTFADYIDFKNNKIVRNCRKKDMSTYAYYLGDTYIKNDEECCWFAAGDNTVRPNSTLTKPYTTDMALSNIMPVYDTYDSEAYSYGTYTYGWGSNIRVSIPLSYIGEATVAAFKNWLKAHNAYEIRVLATPKEEAIDIELPKLNAKTSIIEIDTTIPASNTYGKYVKK